jgi:Zn-dependent protease
MQGAPSARHSKWMNFRAHLPRVTYTVSGLGVMLLMLVLLPPGVAAILLHELGHIVAALACGVAVREVGVCGKGMFIRRKVSGDRATELVISSAGIFVNLVLAWPLLGSRFATANLVLALFNMIPAFGSDGQRILALLRHRDMSIVARSDVEPARTARSA